MEKRQYHQASRSSQTELKTTKLTCQTPTQNLHKLLNGRCLCPGHAYTHHGGHQNFQDILQNCIILCLPWSIHRRCKMQHAKLPSHTLWQIPALRGFHSMSGWYHHTYRGFHITGGQDQQGTLLEKASANLHWVKRQSFFLRTNHSFHKL